jgi:rare lipoprotein A
VSTGRARALMLAATIAFVPAPALAECGVASVYWEGARTANGERFAPDGISAAHKSLPFGSRVIVRNQKTGRSIIVRINDRGPFVAGRIIDLSRGAAHYAGVNGLAPVCLEVISYGSGGRVRTRNEFAANAQALAARAHKLGRTAASVPGRVIQDAAKIGADIVTAPARIIRSISGGHRHAKRHIRRHRHQTRHRRRARCYICE